MSRFITRLLIVLTLVGATSARAAPDQAKGATPWAMVLCTYPGMPARAEWAPATFARLFQPGSGGLTDYFHDISYAAIDVSGTQVLGWYTLPYSPDEASRVLAGAGSIAANGSTLVLTNAQFRASDVGKEVVMAGVPARTTIQSLVYGFGNIALLSKPATDAANGADLTLKRTREALIEDCVDVAHRQGVDFSPYYGVIAMRNDSADSDSTNRGPIPTTGLARDFGRVLLSDGGLGLNVSHIAHEMLHGYNLQHSYDESTTACPEHKAGSDPGVYCDIWDLMSAMDVLDFPGNFALSDGMYRVAYSGPGLNAGNLELMGWLPASRRAVWDGTTTTLQLAPLSRPEWQGALAAIVPLGSASHFITVELRIADRWDQGFAERVTLAPSPSNPAWLNAYWTPASFPGRVFVHEVRIGSDGEPHTWVHKGLTTGGVAQYDLPAGAFYRDQTNNVLISVASISTDGSAAMVTIQLLNPPTGTTTGSSGGGSVDICTTCGPGNKTPRPPIRFQ